MKSIFAIAILGIAAATQATKEWEQFKATHGKEYGSQGEHDTREAIFEENLKFIKKHNAEAAKGLHTFTVAVNQYADLTNGEFTKNMGGLNDQREHRARENEAYETNVTSIPNSVDWREKGYVTPVKNQDIEVCGSCWTFSTTGAVEAAHKRATGELISLSEQQVIDCAYHAQQQVFPTRGCQGGLTSLALIYVMEKGLELEADYPYEARDGLDCRYDKDKAVATVSGLMHISYGDEAQMQNVLATVGPVATVLDASQPSFQFYHGGVYNEPGCNPDEFSHAVLAVGYGTRDGEDYYLVKNSMGVGWGEDGYILVGRNNNNMCGIASLAYYVP